MAPNRAAAHHPALRVAQKAKRAIRFQTTRPAVLAGSEISSSRWKGVVDVFDLEDGLAGLFATTSQPRSLLSIARLNIARSRTRPSICSFVRIAQTCFGRSGGFALVSLPLFQGARLRSAGVAITSSWMGLPV